MHAERRLTTALPAALHHPSQRRKTAEWLEHRAAPLFGRMREMRVVDEAGNVQPDDGVSRGELQVRGPWISAGYYDNAVATDQQMTADGWFRAGDIATLDSDGYLTIHDRAKDLIKSGGEWISSIDLENAALAHPEVTDAAAIAILDSAWSERPMLVLVRRSGSDVDAVAVRDFLAGRVARWWIPDRYAFVEELPRTATGKVSKKTLRERFAQDPDSE